MAIPGEATRPWYCLIVYVLSPLVLPADYSR
jgi:hypothetical protein